MGINLGGGIYSKADNTSEALYSGTGTNSLRVLGNYINGPSIGILVSFDCQAGNAVYLDGNTISVTRDRADGFFLPMACKQYQGTPRPDDLCFRSAPGSNWYQRDAGFTVANAGQSISWGGSPIVSAPLVFDPYDFACINKANGAQYSTAEAYSAFWRGGTGASCY
jgi:hypothetical protein